ncbi:annexin-like protein RJ4 [Andrographis paniculata]|uniref:annexin-like protein RJ4 n=1 Tax=Andrographis paniculata TaxID=175694 RepID=UPI0021E85135|nr:annexin-like protein RJ4 [Andrographis paniculata]
MATIVFPENPSPVADAEAIRKATKGFGTDEKAIIAILGRRNFVQRKLIRHAYQDLYQEDLVKVLESELHGDFERAVYRWILDPEDRDAVLLNVAVKKKPVDHRVVVELSCVTSPEEFLGIKRAYQARFKHSLEEDVAEHTVGDLRQLLVGLVSVYRYHTEEKNAKLADKEADVLHNAIIKDKAFNHEEVVRIVTTRSKAQVVATLNRYKDEQGISITKHLREDLSSEFLSALRTAIKCIDDPKKYFEKTIRHALKRAGTDEDALTRVVVTRAEKDLREIKDLYYKRNSVALEQAVAKETSGDYKAFLLTLLGGQH